MIDEKIIDIFKTALAKSTADQTELVCESEEFYLTRFAENLIHQNMGRSDSTIWCRAINGKKIGIARSNNPTPEGVSDLIRDAIAIADNQKDDPDFNSLVSSIEKPTATGFYDNTFKFPAESRAQAVSEIVMELPGTLISSVKMLFFSTITARIPKVVLWKYWVIAKTVFFDTT